MRMRCLKVEGRTRLLHAAVLAGRTVAATAEVLLLKWTCTLLSRASGSSDRQACHKYYCAKLQVPEGSRAIASDREQLMIFRLTLFDSRLEDIGRMVVG